MRSISPESPMSTYQSPDVGSPATSTAVRIAWWLAGLAAAVRILHFVADPPVWCDELWILRNVSTKSFAELLGPLTDQQAAPPLFLWLERAVFLMFGDSISALRFPMLAASCLTVVLMCFVARRLLHPWGAAWGMLLWGLCDPVINHTCEVKPYVLDAFFAVLAVAAFVGTERWSVRARLVLLAAGAPLVIFASYPGCFVCGGFFAALALPLWRARRDPAAWCAAVAAAILCCGAFLFLLHGPIAAQRTEMLAGWWEEVYLPLGNPVVMAARLVEALLQLLEHFWRPTGACLVVPLTIGVVGLVRSRRWSELALLTGPVALAVAGSFLRSYPLESRLMLFGQPLLTLLIADGLARISAGFARQAFAPGIERSRRAWLGAAAVLSAGVVGLPLVRTVGSLVRPRERLTREVWPETAASRASATTPESIWALRSERRGGRH